MTVSGIYTDGDALLNALGIVVRGGSFQFLLFLRGFLLRLRITDNLRFVSLPRRCLRLGKRSRQRSIRSLIGDEEMAA